MDNNLKLTGAIIIGGVLGWVAVAKFITDPSANFDAPNQTLQAINNFVEHPILTTEFSLQRTQYFWEQKMGRAAVMGKGSAYSPP